MNQYPLSITSKKKNQSSYQSSVLQKSICHHQKPNSVDEKDYKHILVGQRIFIQLYLQGKVVATSYNEWVPFMGGTIYKRINSKVSIFLTNADTKQHIKSIVERLKKINCQSKIISILWFEECFRQKIKVPFDDYELNHDESSQSSVNDSKKEFKLSEPFTKNLKQDLQAEFRDFFKHYKLNSFLKIINKNDSYDSEDVMFGKQIDIGPVKKVIKQKMDDLRKKRKSSGKAKDRKSQIKKQRQKQIVPKIEQSQTLQHQQFLIPRKSFMESLVSKYLKDSVTQPEKQQENVNKTNKEIDETEIKHQEKKKIQKTNELSISKSRSEIKIKSASFKQSQHLRNTVAGMKYKNNQFQLKHRSQRIRSPQQTPIQNLSKIEQKLQNNKYNSLIVIASSTTLRKKIEQFNSNFQDIENGIYLNFISYEDYSLYLQNYSRQNRHIVFYIYVPNRIIDRVHYYFLYQKQPSIRLIKNRFIDELTQYNRQIKMHLRSPKRVNFNLFKYIKPSEIEINTTFCKGKLIACLQNECLKPKQAEKLITQLGGIYHTSTDYLMKNEAYDLLITNRSSIKDKIAVTITEEQFIKQAISIIGQ